MVFQGIIWAGLSVHDMDREIAFFRDEVGLKFLRQGSEGDHQWAHFSAGGGALFELFSGGIASAEVKSAEQQSISISFLVENLDEVMTSMKVNGVRFLGEAGKFRNQRWAHFVDPENNRLEIKEIRSM